MTIKTKSFALGGDDYLVDGRPLMELLVARGHTDKDSQAYPLIDYPDVRERLALKAEPNYLFNRHALYHCGYCGGEDGNGISAVIDHTGDTILWHDFAVGSDGHEDSVWPFEKPLYLEFDAKSYFRAFEDFDPDYWTI